jgi:hypothetical protein
VRAGPGIVTRNTDTIEFDRKVKAWDMFCSLYQAGRDGKTRAELMKVLWPQKAVEENNLDQQKKALNQLLQRLGLEVSADSRGVWSLAAVV